MPVLDFTDLVNAAVALPPVRAIVLETEFRFWYFRVRHGLENDHRLDPDVFYLVARRCAKHIKRECELDPDNALAFLDADLHRAEHEETTLATGVWCEYCACMDPKDVRRLHAHFFNLYPLVFLRVCAGSYVAAFPSNVFHMYVESPFYSPTPYGQYYSGARYIECNAKECTGDDDDEANELSNLVLQRGLLIPSWFLRKYFNYLSSLHNPLYNEILRRANPGRKLIAWVESVE